MGRVFEAPCAVVPSAENVVQPHILFIRQERVGIICDANINGPPDLVIEILSPATRSKDLELKRKTSARFGVQEYWLFDPDAASIEVLVWGEIEYSTYAILGESDRLSSSLLPQLNLPFYEIFA